ncbi:polyprenol phosphomannose-dependent alpha 1,6 mannosyltransferase MptB [Nocardioides marmoraquaticus]
MLSRGLTGSVLVLLGSLPLAVLDGTTAGRMAALVVVLAGLGLVGSAWLELCAGASLGEVSLRRVHAATALWTLPLLPAPPLFSNDGWSYAAQGALTSLGVSPYVWTPSLLSGSPLGDAVDPVWQTTPAPYGPLTLQLGGLAAGVTQDPYLLVLAHRAVALVGVALLAWALPRLAVWSGVDGTRASALVLPSPILLAHGVGGLHNDVLVVGLVAAALVVARDRGWVAGAVLVGAATAVKAPGLLGGVGVVLLTLPVAAPLLTRLARGAAVAGVAVGVTVAVGVPSGLGVGWVHALGVPGTFTTPLSLTSVLGAGLGVQPALRTLGLVVATGVVLAVALRAPTGRPAPAVRATALAIGAVLLLGPVVHLWYLLWLLPLLAVLRLGPRPTWLLVAVGLVGGVAAPLDSSLHGLYLVVVVGTALAVAVATLLLVLDPHRTRVRELVSR